jgi:hypothetical protein
MHRAIQKSNKRRREGSESEQPSKRTAGEASGYNTGSIAGPSSAANNDTGREEANSMPGTSIIDPESLKRLVKAKKSLEDALMDIAKGAAESGHPDVSRFADPREPPRTQPHSNPGQTLRPQYGSVWETAHLKNFFASELQDVSRDTSPGDSEGRVSERSEIEAGDRTPLPRGFNGSLSSIDYLLRNGLLEDLQAVESSGLGEHFRADGWEYDIMIRSKSLAVPCGGHVRAVVCHSLEAAAEAVRLAMYKCKDFLQLTGAIEDGPYGLPIWIGRDVESRYEMSVLINRRLGQRPRGQGSRGEDSRGR